MSGIRTIYFSVTQSLVEYNKSKNDKGFNASLILNYQQSDYNFNESVWDGMAADVKAFVEKKGCDYQYYKSRRVMKWKNPFLRYRMVGCALSYSLVCLRNDQK